MTALTPTLVVVVNNGADWQRIVDEGWYRIPLRHAPSPVAAEFLAFYLTRRVGVDVWQVRYYAPVRHYCLRRRCELFPAEPAHPRADDWYYRVEVGPLQSLTRPLPSRQLRRISFIPTTLEQLHIASDVADLWLTNDEEAVLWSYFPDAARKATKRMSIGEGRGTYRVAQHDPQCSRGRPSTRRNCWLELLPALDLQWLDKEHSLLDRRVSVARLRLPCIQGAFPSHHEAGPFAQQG